MNLEGDPNKIEAPLSTRQSKRARPLSAQEEYSFEGSSESGGDFSPDGTEDEYVPPKNSVPSSRKVTKSLRGINAYRAAVGARTTEWHVQTIEADASRSIPVSRGRGRGRGRSRARGSSFVGRRENRPEMLAEHRQLVESLEEEDIAHGSQDATPSPNPKLPQLSDGNSNRFVSFVDIC